MLDPSYHDSACMGTQALPGVFLIGGALMTCLRSFRNFRYSGVFLMSCWLSSATFSLSLGSDITPPPDWSSDPKSDASRRPIRELCGSVLHPLTHVRYNESFARLGI